MVKAEVNKSQRIRDMLATDPDLPMRSIVSALAGKGVKVKPSLVYALTSQMKSMRRRAVRLPQHFIAVYPR